MAFFRRSAFAFALALSAMSSTTHAREKIGRTHMFDERQIDMANANEAVTEASVGKKSRSSETSHNLLSSSGKKSSGKKSGGTPATIKERLAKYALDGGKEFKDPDSYQSKALQKVEAQEGALHFDDAKLTQYYSLYCVFFATFKMPNAFFLESEVSEWIDTTGWQETDIDPCDGWFGITCNLQGLVTSIDLFENGLSGNFPPEVVILASDGPFASGAGNLARIDLFGNVKLSNFGDSSWLSDLGSSMTSLFVSSTFVTGNLATLPENLVDFEAAFSLFTGGLTDSTFEGMPSLNLVELSGNVFNSTVPSVFGRLPSLEFLYLSDSFVFGDLAYMEGMPAMVEHFIDVNPGIGGKIPSFIGDITTLVSFSAVDNSLEGPIPASLGNLPLVRLFLTANALTGTIPPELGNSPDLEDLFLAGNVFTGTMPEEICNLNLAALGADCNDPEFTCSCCTCCSVEECEF